MESKDFESAVRNAVFIGGDTDTNAAIAGALAEAYYGLDKIPTEFFDEMYKRITDEMKSVVADFYSKYVRAC
jgi:ADP-ribosylglycohydrolase